MLSLLQRSRKSPPSSRSCGWNLIAEKEAPTKCVCSPGAQTRWGQCQAREASRRQICRKMMCQSFSKGICNLEFDIWQHMMIWDCMTICDPYFVFRNLLFWGDTWVKQITCGSEWVRFTSNVWLLMREMEHVFGISFHWYNWFFSHSICASFMPYELIWFTLQ